MSSVLEQKANVVTHDPFRRQLNRLALATILLAGAFALPLVRLAGFVIHSELYSYIPLIPIISWYLIWTNRKGLFLEARPSWPPAIFLFVAGAALVAGYWRCRAVGGDLAKANYLAWFDAAELCFFWGLCFAFVGWKMVRQVAFPLAFLIFVVPLPTALLAGIDTFFQHTSSAAAAGFCMLVGTPVLRDGVELHMPGMTLLVGPECSGIHSTWVLIMTSLLGAYLFMKRNWTRAVLVLAVVPLAILRNGFRVFVIGELCVHISPDMINSPIHRHGGPLFFTLALIPFFLLLLWLRKLDGRNTSVVQSVQP